MRRIATPMVGGMISATVLALLVIPAAYFLWQQRQIVAQTPDRDDASQANSTNSF